MNPRKLVLIVSVPVLALTLGLVGAGIASAASGGANTAGTGAAKPMAVSHAKACKDLWAVVNSDGSLARAGCPSTTSDQLQTGSYEVVFNRSIANCADEATLGQAGQGGNPTSGMIGVAGRAGNVDSEYVQVANATGAVADQGFHLVVTC